MNDIYVLCVIGMIVLVILLVLALMGRDVLARFLDWLSIEEDDDEDKDDAIQRRAW